MYQRIAHISLVVKDYDDAIEFYTQKLDFTLLEDTRIDEKKRWVNGRIYGRLYFVSSN